MPEVQAYLEELVLCDVRELHRKLQAFLNALLQELDVWVGLHDVGGLLNQVQVAAKNR